MDSNEFLNGAMTALADVHAKTGCLAPWMLVKVDIHHLCAVLEPGKRPSFLIAELVDVAPGHDPAWQRELDNFLDSTVEERCEMDFVNDGGVIHVPDASRGTGWVRLKLRGEANK